MEFGEPCIEYEYVCIGTVLMEYILCLLWLKEQLRFGEYVLYYCVTVL